MSNSYRYFVVFYSEVQNSSPIIFKDAQSIKKEHSTFMHLFDEEMINIIDGIEYCLNLPRNDFDICDTDIDILYNNNENSHDIVILPSSIVNQTPQLGIPDLVICDDRCFLSVKESLKNLKPILGFVSVKDLTSQLLKEHWKKLAENRFLKTKETISNFDNVYLLKDEKLLFLPSLFVARQFQKDEEVYCNAFNNPEILERQIYFISNQNCCVNSLYACRNYTDNEDEFKKKYSEESAKPGNRRFNIVVTFPGLPPFQRKKTGCSAFMPSYERRILRILSVHKAIAKHAVIIELKNVSDDLFNKLNELELNLKQEREPNNKYVNKALRDLGILFDESLSNMEKNCFRFAINICVFSDFPLGMIILPGTDTSLFCFKQVSHLPITPLTRCAQIELVKHPLIYLGNKCKILFIDCISGNSYTNIKIKERTKDIFETVDICKKNNEKFLFDFYEVTDVDTLKKTLNKSDAHILILSAHGFYDREKNITGIQVGTEEWLGTDNDYKVPPVVLMSSCHVSPRGSGCVNIADMFFRCGAETILGTLIPISVERNLVLFSRLLLYIAEAQKGSKQYKNISEVWSGVVTTNAIHELIESSSRLKKWMYSNNKNGILRLEDFELNRCPGRIKSTTAYADSICIIKEMLFEEGMQNSFSNILDLNDYFPESSFYEWMGCPENVLLYSEIISKLLEEKEK